MTLCKGVGDEVPVRKFAVKTRNKVGGIGIDQVRRRCRGQIRSCGAVSGNLPEAASSCLPANKPIVGVRVTGIDTDVRIVSKHVRVA